MSISEIKSLMPEYAKDIKLNIGAVSKADGVNGLTQNQISAILLACAYKTANQKLISYILAEVSEHLSETEINAAKIASTIMAMNNVYYRFVHLEESGEYGTMPAGLRMNMMMKHGVDKIDFEYYSLAVSAMEGCGMCIDSHVKSLKQEGAKKEAIQASVKIASVVQAVAQVFAIENIA